MRTILLLSTILLGSCAPAPQSLPTNPTFAQYYQHLRQKVAQAGHNPKLLDAAFGKEITPRANILKSHANQPESTRTFASYLGPMLKGARLATARRMVTQHQVIGAQLHAQTGVDLPIIIALWGVESDFGRNMGTQPIIPALVTLGYKGERRAFWEAELLAAMQVQRQVGLPPQQLIGSWAGAMGQCQFMPRTYLAHAADGDGDGRANIWQSTPDTLASIANFLSHLGYRSNTPWRLPVTTALRLDGLTINPRGLSTPLTLAQWHTRGLPASAARSGLSVNSKWRYYKPQASAPAMLVGPNFQALLDWNNSSYFATSALTLADMLRKPN